MTSEHPNPGNFANDPGRAAEAGHKGGLTNTENKGFASENYPEDKKHEVQSAGGHASGGQFEADSDRTREIASMGGKASGGKFKKGDPRTREIASMGGKASGGGGAGGDEEEDDEEYVE